MFIEHMLDKHVFGYDNKTMAGLKDIKTIFSKQIVKDIVFVKKIIHIQKVILAHMANVLGCHSFWWMFYVFFAQCLHIWFHGKYPPLRGL